MMQALVDDPEALESAYGQLKGQWEWLKDEMGPWRYYSAFIKNLFSINRFTMMRLIKKDIPPEAE